MLERSDYEFKARKHLGQRADWSEDERALYESIDIMEQRTEWLCQQAVITRNALVVIGVVLLAVAGPQVLELIVGWMKP